MGVRCGSVAGKQLSRKGGKPVNEIRMNLLERNETEVFGGDCGLESASILEDVLAFVPFHKTEVQSVCTFEIACAAETRAETVNEPRKVLEGSESQYFHSLDGFKHPRRRNGCGLSGFRLLASAAIPLG